MSPRPDLSALAGRRGLFVEGGWVVLAEVAAASADRLTATLELATPAPPEALACNVLQRPPRFTDRMPFGRSWTVRHALDTFALRDRSAEGWLYSPFTFVFDPEAVAAFARRDLGWMDDWF